MKKRLCPAPHGVLLITLFIGMTWIPLVSADQYCEMKHTVCPENFHNQTIYVPQNVTRISSDFLVCMPSNFIEDATSAGSSPSIMFLIDHSGSMSGVNGYNNPTDTAGSRFTVTKALIDTIAKKYPKAEVGLVIFQNALYIDTDNQPYAVPLPDGYPYPDGIRSQGYIPLMRLDSTLSDGRKAIELIKSMLDTEKVPRPGRGQTTDLVYKPKFETDYYTNINTAFDAAKYAMMKTSSPKDYQFVIFLSDGLPQPDESAYDLHGNEDPDNFEKGTDVPTTFTVYFVPRARDPIPASITQMTRNIKNNGYSENNSLSAVWGIQTSHHALLDVLMNQAINPIFSLIKKEPSRIVLNGKPYTSYNFADSAFHIPDLVLQNDRTTFDMSITYKIIKDASHTTDTTVHITFDVVRTDSEPLSKAYVELICRDTIYYQVSVSATTPNASEQGPTNGTIEFRRDNSDHGDLTVYFSISGKATPGEDYKPVPDSIVFTGTQKTAIITIEPLADNLIEEDETVQITLLENKPGRVIRYNVMPPHNATVTIKDYQPKGPDTLLITVVPNPLSLQENKRLRNYIDDNAQKYYSNVLKNHDRGMLISVFSTSRLEPVPGDPNTYGTAFIYDAVGNLLKHLDLQKASDLDSTIYGMVWDGTNKQNRMVGGGVYLLKLKIKNTDGISHVLSKKIGIQF